MILQRHNTARQKRWLTRTLLCLKIGAVLAVLVLAGCAYPLNDSTDSDAQLSLQISSDTSASAIGQYEELSLTVFAIQESLLNDAASSDYRNYLSAIFGGGAESAEVPEISSQFAAANVRASSPSGSTELRGLQPNESYLVGIVAAEPAGNALPVFAASARLSLQAGENQASLSPNSNVDSLITDLSGEYNLDMIPNLFTDLDFPTDQFLVAIEPGSTTITLISELTNPQPGSTVNMITFSFVPVQECSVLDCSGNGTTYNYPGSGSQVPEPGDLVSIVMVRNLPIETEGSLPSDFSQAEYVALAVSPGAEPGFEEELGFEYQLISSASLTATELQAEGELSLPPPHNLSWSITFENEANTTVDGELLGATPLVPIVDGGYDGPQ